MKLQYFFLFLTFLSVPAFAETEKESAVDPLIGFFVIEGAVAVNAALASVEPKAYGIVLSLLSPLGASDEVSDATNWVGIGSAVSLGLYNAIELSDEEYSKNDIFIRNVYGWHALGAIVAITEWLTGTEVESERFTLLPSKEGVFLSMNYEF